MLALDCGAETGCKRMNSLHFAYRLLIRRSLVRAQVGEPHYKADYVESAFTFCSAICSLLRNSTSALRTIAHPDDGLPPRGRHTGTALACHRR